MTWPPPDRRNLLGSVQPTTYAWGYAASCACGCDWATYSNPDDARTAAHNFAQRCPMAERRRTNHRRQQREMA